MHASIHMRACGVVGGEYCMYLMVLGDIKALLVVPHPLFGQWESRDLEREREFCPWCVPIRHKMREKERGGPD